MTTETDNTNPYTAPPLLVVTDLDGTLLDHYNYSFYKASEALDRLRELGIPLIFNTSKTAAELRPLCQELGINYPFVVENGSGIFLPRDSFPLPPGGKAFSQEYYLVELGVGYQEILDRLAPLRERYQFKGFSDMTLSEVEQLTGLGEEQAERARKRRFSEPLIWEDSDEARQEFIEELKGMGLATLKGGRFMHVLGTTDKGAALDQLRVLYTRTFGLPFKVIALGDSDNDIAMLEAADWPVIVRSPAHGPPKLKCEQPVTVSDNRGPAGWNKCVLALVEKFLSEQESN